MDLGFYSSLTVMPTFYTVDRLGTLRTGLTVDSSQDYANCQFHTTLGGPTRTDLEVHLAGLFPDGLSKHGKFYLLNHSLINPTWTPGVPSGSMVPVSPMIELIAELVRRNDFPSSTTAVDTPGAHRRVVDNGTAGLGTDVGAAILTTTLHGQWSGAFAISVGTVTGGSPER